MEETIKIDDKYLKGLESFGIPYIIIKNNSINEKDFDYVPELGFYVAKERKLLRKNWFDSQNELHSKNEKMLTLPEFKEYLKFVRENNKEIYDEITKVKSPWRAEWLDADFKTQGKNLIVNYNTFEDGKIVQKSAVLDKDTLMKDKTPGISLENWLEDSTPQGLPSENIKLGDLFYWYPRSDNNSVAWFVAYDDGAFLDCGRGPSDGGGNLGVRAAKLRE